MCKYIINISPSLDPSPMWPTYLPPSNYRVNNLIVKSVILVGMSNRAILQSIAVTYLPHKFQYNMVLLLVSTPLYGVLSLQTTSKYSSSTFVL